MRVNRTMKIHSGNSSGRLWLWLIVAMSAFSFMIFLWSPLSGDDLGYCGVFSGSNPRYGYLHYPRFAAGHWLHVNGRFMDKLMPLVMNLPKGLLALVCAAALAAMYAFAVRASGVLKGWAPVVLVASLACVLPWWDSSFVFAVQVNYVWSTAFVLAAFALIAGGATAHGLRGTALLLLCFLAGMSHEGASVPMLGGWILYAVVSGWRPDAAQRRLLCAFALGVLSCVFSPAFWSRVGASAEPNDTPMLLLLKSEPAVLLLWASIAAAMFVPSWRRTVARASRGYLAVLVYATLFGAPVILVSGIVGRSGWFVTAYALIAIAGFVGQRYRVDGRMPLLSWGISIALLAMTAGEAWLQHGLWLEYQKYEKAFIASSDGVVEGDYTADDDLPAWTLNRLRGVPDADDLFLLESLSNYYRNDSVAPVLVGPSTEFVTVLPHGARRFVSGWLEVWLWENEDGEWVFTPCRGKYAVDRRILDPGDR